MLRFLFLLCFSENPEKILLPTPSGLTRAGCGHMLCLLSFNSEEIKNIYWRRQIKTQKTQFLKHKIVLRNCKTAKITSFLVFDVGDGEAVGLKQKNEINYSRTTKPFITSMEVATYSVIGPILQLKLWDCEISSFRNIRSMHNSWFTVAPFHK